MRERDYERVCYLTEQREERVPLRHLSTGEIGFSVGCTHEGSTVQVMLPNGERDSWQRQDCSPVSASETIH